MIAQPGAADSGRMALLTVDKQGRIAEILAGDFGLLRRYSAVSFTGDLLSSDVRLWARNQFNNLRRPEPFHHIPKPLRLSRELGRLVVRVYADHPPGSFLMVAIEELPTGKYSIDRFNLTKRELDVLLA